MDRTEASGASDRGSNPRRPVRIPCVAWGEPRGSYDSTKWRDRGRSFAEVDSPERERWDPKGDVFPLNRRAIREGLVPDQ